MTHANFPIRPNQAKNTLSFTPKNVIARAKLNSSQPYLAVPLFPFFNPPHSRTATTELSTQIIKPNFRLSLLWEQIGLATAWDLTGERKRKALRKLSLPHGSLNWYGMKNSKSRLSHRLNWTPGNRRWVTMCFVRIWKVQCQIPTRRYLVLFSMEKYSQETKKIMRMGCLMCCGELKALMRSIGLGKWNGLSDERIRFVFFCTLSKHINWWWSRYTIEWIRRVGITMPTVKETLVRVVG